VRVVRAEAEWYIQHVCERVLMEDAHRLWGPSLTSLQAAGHQLTIATTNYDRAVELAAARVGVAIEDGFAAFGDQEWCAWQGFNGSPGSCRLLKVHGSTDWYHANGEGRVVKLRHAMPLYGRVNIQVTAELLLRSAAVLPSREKRVNLPPYPDISHEFRRVSKSEAEVAVFVGTSMRDPDILDVYRQCVARMPTFLVGRKDRDAYGGTLLRQSASAFLISTLPRALRGDVIGVLRDSHDAVLIENVLDPLLRALDASQSASVRCDAIERLAMHDVRLGRGEVEIMLRSRDTDVRRYALALIEGSRDRADLLEIAAQVAGEVTDQDFTGELALLRRLLEMPESAPTGS